MIRETIIRKIVERDVAGESLLEDDVRRDNELLHAAAFEEFGAWNTALEYAGVDAGQSTTYTEVCLENRDKAMAIRRTFGSWKAALAMAGIG